MSDTVLLEANVAEYFEDVAEEFLEVEVAELLGGDNRHRVLRHDWCRASSGHLYHLHDDAGACFMEVPTTERPSRRGANDVPHVVAHSRLTMVDPKLGEVRRS